MTVDDATLKNLEKDLEAAKAIIGYLQSREALLRKQFAFYVEHGKQPWEADKELPKL
jgi:hypothetical protein